MKTHNELWGLQRVVAGVRMGDYQKDRSLSCVSAVQLVDDAGGELRLSDAYEATLKIKKGKSQRLALKLSYGCLEDSLLTIEADGSAIKQFLVLPEEIAIADSGTEFELTEFGTYRAELPTRLLAKAMSGKAAPDSSRPFARLTLRLGATLPGTGTLKIAVHAAARQSTMWQKRIIVA